MSDNLHHARCTNGGMTMMNPDDASAKSDTNSGAFTEEVKSFTANRSSNSPSPMEESSAAQKLPTHKATGPRTNIGKQRASRNATKHRLFTKYIVLPGESRTEYERLLAGLKEDLRPVGVLEDLIVEKIATIVWRYRRLLQADAAEIQKNKQFVEWDQQNPQTIEPVEIQRTFSVVPAVSRGLILNIYDPKTLSHCLSSLAELHQQIEANGLDRVSDTVVLERIYGDREGIRAREDLYDLYLLWLASAEIPDEERMRVGYASRDQCREKIIRGIRAEIRRLRQFQTKKGSVETARTQLEILSRSVPDGPGLDRLLRCEASLERAFERALSQLERLQRMRLGQPVPPRIELDVKH